MAAVRMHVLLCFDDFVNVCFEPLFCFLKSENFYLRLAVAASSTVAHCLRSTVVCVCVGVCTYDCGSSLTRFLPAILLDTTDTINRLINSFELCAQTSIWLTFWLTFG